MRNQAAYKREEEEEGWRTQGEFIGWRTAHHQDLQTARANCDAIHRCISQLGLGPAHCTDHALEHILHAEPTLDAVYSPDVSFCTP